MANVTGGLNTNDNSVSTRPDSAKDSVKHLSSGTPISVPGVKADSPMTTRKAD